MPKQRRSAYEYILFNGLHIPFITVCFTCGFHWPPINNKKRRIVEQVAGAGAVGMLLRLPCTVPGLQCTEGKRCERVLSILGVYDLVHVDNVADVGVCTSFWMNYSVVMHKMRYSVSRRTEKPGHSLSEIPLQILAPLHFAASLFAFQTTPEQGRRRSLIS
jgi:hypothetical protein